MVITSKIEIAKFTLVMTLILIIGYKNFILFVKCVKINTDVFLCGIINKMYFIICTLPYTICMLCIAGSHLQNSLTCDETDIGMLLCVRAIIMVLALFLVRLQSQHGSMMNVSHSLLYMVMSLF